MFFRRFRKGDAAGNLFRADTGPYVYRGDYSFPRRVKTITGGMNMQAYPSDKIRNVALIGHGGCGKTSLMELALFETGVITRAGTIEDGNTVSDYDKMEIEKGHSINMSIIPIEYKDVKINFIDTPGLLDFSHEMYTAIQAAAAALLIRMSISQRRGGTM